MIFPAQLCFSTAATLAKCLYSQLSLSVPFAMEWVHHGLEGLASVISQGNKCYFSLIEQWCLLDLGIRFRFHSIFIFHKSKYVLKYLKEMSSYKIRKQLIGKKSEIWLKLLLGCVLEHAFPFTEGRRIACVWLSKIVFIPGEVFDRQAVCTVPVGGMMSYIRSLLTSHRGHLKLDYFFFGCTALHMGS